VRRSIIKVEAKRYYSCSECGGRIIMGETCFVDWVENDNLQFWEFKRAICLKCAKALGLE